MDDASPAFIVEPYGKRWAVKSGDEVLLIAARKDDAAALAEAAAATLRRSPGGARPLHEDRSFAPKR